MTKHPHPNIPNSKKKQTSGRVLDVYTHDGPMGFGIFTDPWRVDFSMVFHAGKSKSRHIDPMGISWESKGTPPMPPPKALFPGIINYHCPLIRP